MINSKAPSVAAENDQQRQSFIGSGSVGQRERPRIYSICILLLICISGPTVRAGGLLDGVPEDATGFLYLRQAAKTAANIPDFRNPKATVGPIFDLVEFESVLGFSPGTIDLDRPVLVVFMEPIEYRHFLISNGMREQDHLWPVVGFYPKEVSLFEPSDRRIYGTYHGPYGKLNTILRDEMVFASPLINKRSLRRVRRAYDNKAPRMAVEQSVVSAVTDCDIAVHFDLKGARSIYLPTISAIAQLAKLSALQQIKDPEKYPGALKLADWLTGSVVNAIEEMDAITLTAKVGENDLSLAHHHTFSKSGFMGEYLGKVRRSGFDRFEIFENSPFLASISIDWNTPEDCSFSTMFVNRCVSDPVVVQNLGPEKVKKIQSGVRELCRVSKGQEVQLSVEGIEKERLCIRGATVIENAEGNYQEHRIVQEFSNEMMSSVFPGIGDMRGGTEKKIRDGRTYYQVELTSSDMSDEMRRNVEFVYGKDAVYEEAVLPPKHIVFSIGPPETGLTKFFETKEHKKGLANNPRIKASLAGISDKSQVVALLDVGRLATAVPILMEAGGAGNGGNGAMQAFRSTLMPTEFGPILCWSGRAQERVFTGEFQMTKQDLEDAVRILSQIAENVAYRGDAKGTSKRP